MEVQKVGDISYAEYMQEFYQPRFSIVFKNASKVWKGKGIFNPDWFRNQYGERRTELGGVSYSIREITEMVENSTEDNPAPYPCIFNIPETLPEILDLLQPLNLNYARPNWLDNKWFKIGNWGNETELFIGGSGGKFPYVHLDYYHLNAWITQLYGEKWFTLYPRGQEQLPYPLTNDPWRSEINVFNSNFQNYPRYKKAATVHFLVGARETLFIPFGTWHATYSIIPTISVAFDQLNIKNYKDFLRDVWSFKKMEMQNESHC